MTEEATCVSFRGGEREREREGEEEEEKETDSKREAPPIFGIKGLKPEREREREICREENSPAPRCKML
ncbi:hypothetical protein AAFF_G00251260 [Aldrovandia affinis]|uniref:Uncharacterized protein n=1 Tax=Aldrovandia affinis TaxID=143900 RepID=A0AAD7RCS8_9TELE|nr:hypothetical protein AAFF_G00251260 [Aldrovandia affinis]